MTPFEVVIERNGTASSAQSLNPDRSSTDDANGASDANGAGNTVIVIMPVVRVCRANVHANPFVCFRFGGCQSNQPECCQSQAENFGQRFSFQS